jgi:Sulfotransferase domain
MQDCPVWHPFQSKSGRLVGWSHGELTLAMRKHISADYAVMVDSSKTAWGSLSIPFSLFRKVGRDFLLVHLVRDPRGVCWSAMRKPRRPKNRRWPSGRLFESLQVAIGWTASHLACEAFGWSHPKNYLRVRYEDLVHTPAEVIGGILRRVSLSSPPSLEPSDARDNRHQLYGNAMRFRPLSLAGLREDVAWKTLMPRSYRMLTRSLCWPLSLRYGYGRKT